MNGTSRERTSSTARAAPEELAGIEDEVALLAGMHRFPEIGDVAAGAALDVDQPL